MRNAFIRELTNLAKDDKVIALLADNGIIVFDEYRKRFPRQFINVGIAESNMISMSAGMASCGLKPFVYSIIPFLTMRPYEFIKNDICYQNLNVKLIGIGAGFAYSTLGATHHAIEDISLMKTLPNMIVVSPADPFETTKATKALYELTTPAYMRLGTGKNPPVYTEDYEFVLGKGVVLKEGEDIALISTGTILTEILKVTKTLEADGISVKVINIHTIKPIDEELIIDTANKIDTILTVEEHLISGGLGSGVAEILSEKVDSKINFKRLGLNDCFCQGYGTIEKVRKLNKLDKDSVVTEAKNLLHTIKTKTVVSYGWSGTPDVVSVKKLTY